MPHRFIALSLLLLAFPALAEVCNTDEIAPSTPTSRFTDNANGTVTDTVTGLVWKTCVQGQQWDSATGTCLNYGVPYTWVEALQQAAAEGGAWRLPTLKELASIVEHQCYGPAINAEVFPNAPAGYADTLALGYWSSTPFTLDVGATDAPYPNAWYLDAFKGIGYHALKTNENYVRLVRNGP